MAEAAKRASSEDVTSRRSQWKDVAAQVGVMALTGFLSGLSMMAGQHAYASIARRCGGQPNNVVPLRKVV
jgi:hypothetical protein